MGWGEWYDSGISLVLSIVLLVLGGIPLLNEFGVISLSLGPLDQLVGKVFLYICALGGAWLLFDALWGKEGELLKWSAIILGIVVLAAGVIPLLYQFEVIAFTLPFLTMTMYHILFVVEGVLLVFSAFNQ